MVPTHEPSGCQHHRVTQREPDTSFMHGPDKPFGDAIVRTARKHPKPDDARPVHSYGTYPRCACLGDSQKPPDTAPANFRACARHRDAPRADVRLRETTGPSDGRDRSESLAQIPLGRWVRLPPPRPTTGEAPARCTDTGSSYGQRHDPAEAGPQRQPVTAASGVPDSQCRSWAYLIRGTRSSCDSVSLALTAALRNHGGRCRRRETTPPDRMRGRDAPH